MPNYSPLMGERGSKFLKDRPQPAPYNPQFISAPPPINQGSGWVGDMLKGIGTAVGGAAATQGLGLGGGSGMAGMGAPDPYDSYDPANYASVSSTGASEPFGGDPSSGGMFGGK